MVKLDPLRAAIEKHLPCTKGLITPYSNATHSETDALSLASALDNPAAYFGHWKVTKEEANLDALRHALDKAEMVMQEMHPMVRFVLSHSEAKDEDLAESKDRNVGLIAKRMLTDHRRFNSLDAIQYVRAKLKPAYASATEVASKGKPPGRRNWEATVVVELCRILWCQHTGNCAPRSVNDGAPGPFGEFLTDVFGALKLNASPSAAMDSWRQIKSYAKKAS